MYGRDGGGVWGSLEKGAKGSDKVIKQKSFVSNVEATYSILLACISFIFI